MSGPGVAATILAMICCSTSARASASATWRCSRCSSWRCSRSCCLGARGATGRSPALLWVVLLFTSLLGLARSFAAEAEGGALALLAQVPVDRGWVFLGKAGANALALLGVELWAGVLFTVFLGVDWGASWAAALGAGVLGALGLAAVGTLLAALAAAARFREVLLPVLLFPLVLPVLVLASRITGLALDGREIPGLYWAMLALFDWVFALIGYFVFDSVLEE
jgi:heme exporter protein B